MNDSVRVPVASGMFYPADPDALQRMVRRFVGSSAEPSVSAKSSAGLIVPHAGYVYSGAVAGAAFREAMQLGRPDVIVLLGASHSGLGPWAALPPHAEWATPLGTVPVDQELVSALSEGEFEQDVTPFVREHSMEVQLPFFQAMWESPPPIVPICVRPTLSKYLTQAGDVLMRCLAGRVSWIVASSDFTHYEADDVARDRDGQALERILALDFNGFRALVREARFSICGAGAIELLLRVSTGLGLMASQLVEYATSGDATGDRSSVVGYASVVFRRGET